MDHRFLQPATAFLHAGLSDCPGWISRPDMIYQNSWTQTFDQLELKYFHIAQFLLNARLAAHRLQKVRTGNLKFKTNLALVCNKFSPMPSKISFHMKQKVTCCGQKFTNHENLVNSWTVKYSKSGSMFFSRLKRACRCPQQLQPTRKRPVLVLARLTRPSCAREQPQELGLWFCSQNLRLSSGIAFGSDCQMTSRGSNMDSNLNSVAWPMGCRAFICPKVPKSTVWSLNSF